MSDDKQKPEDQPAEPSRWATRSESDPEAPLEAAAELPSEDVGADLATAAIDEAEDPLAALTEEGQAAEALGSSDGPDGPDGPARPDSSADADSLESLAQEAELEVATDLLTESDGTDPEPDAPSENTAPEESDTSAKTDSELAPEAAAGAALAAARPAKSGRGVAWLSLLLALGAAGGAGYLYYELIYLQPFASQYAPLEAINTIEQVERKVTRNTELEQNLEAEVESLRAELERVESEQSSTASTLSSNVESVVGDVERKLREQTETLRTTEQQLMSNLNEVANRAPPTRAEWKVAEVEYLLRIANHRVLMEKDADGGLRLLETADAMLAELDDFGFYQVRAQLAEEILALRRVGEVDSQGMFLRLEAVKRELDGLPLKVPELLRDGPTTSLDEDAGLWARILDQFTPYFAYRSELRTRIEPLLAPDEITYLELNLRLMLEQAQLASLRAQQEIFEQSLDNASDWIKDHLDYEDADVARIVAEIEDLRDSSVLRDLPDISGSLRSLLDTERGT